MKKLPITKEAFEKSNYFKNKYGKLEYVSESGKVFKTDKGRILMFKESNNSVIDRSFGGGRHKGYQFSLNDFPGNFPKDKFMSLIESLSTDHCKLKVCNLKHEHRMFVQWVGEKLKDQTWGDRLSRLSV